MTSRKRASLKARIGIATAVLVGGGAIGVAAVATSGHSSTTSTQSAGYTINFRHTVPMGTALSSAFSSLQYGHEGNALYSLAHMTSMRYFGQTWHHHTLLAAQRGVVVLATKHFLLVKSVNGSLHLWWLSGTKVFNVSSTATGMTAMTGSNQAALSAMKWGNMTPATVTMAGGTSAVNSMAAPVAKPTTVTVSTGNTTITITISSSSASVTSPAMTPATTTSTASMMTAPGAMAGGQMAKSWQPTFMASKGVQRGDLVFISGLRTHGFLIAKLVLFAAPKTTTTPPATTGVAPTSSSGSFSGTHS